MFLSEQHHQKDEKNRIRIPQVFRDELGSKFYFAKLLPGILYIFTEKHVNEKIAELSAKANEYIMEDIEALIEFSSNVKLASEDKQGRVTIPDEYVTHASLGKEIVTIGSGTFLIMMSSELREQQKNKNRESKIERLSEMRQMKG